MLVRRVAPLFGTVEINFNNQHPPDNLYSFLPTTPKAFIDYWDNVSKKCPANFVVMPHPSKPDTVLFTHRDKYIGRTFENDLIDFCESIGLTAQRIPTDESLLVG